jgi:hypothetical protein
MQRDGEHTSILSGALTGQMVVRLGLEGNRVVAEQRVLEGERGRIRDIRTGPDGLLYVSPTIRRGTCTGSCRPRTWRGRATAARHSERQAREMARDPALASDLILVNAMPPPKNVVQCLRARAHLQ